MKTRVVFEGGLFYSRHSQVTRNTFEQALPPSSVEFDDAIESAFNSHDLEPSQKPHRNQRSISRLRLASLSNRREENLFPHLLVLVDEFGEGIQHFAHDFERLLLPRDKILESLYTIDLLASTAVVFRTGGILRVEKGEVDEVPNGVGQRSADEIDVFVLGSDGLGRATEEGTLREDAIEVRSNRIALHDQLGVFGACILGRGKLDDGNCIGVGRYLGVGIGRKAEGFEFGLNIDELNPFGLERETFEVEGHSVAQGQNPVRIEHLEGPCKTDAPSVCSVRGERGWLGGYFGVVALIKIEERDQGAGGSH